MSKVQSTCDFTTDKFDVIFPAALGSFQKLGWATSTYITGGELYVHTLKKVKMHVSYK